MTHKFQLKAHVSYVDINVVNNPVELRRRPEWQGGGSIVWTLSQAVKLSAVYTSQSKFFDSSIPTGVLEVDGYDRV